jgi:hypothetical protein
MKSKTFLYILIVLAIIAIGAFVIYQIVYQGSAGTGGGGLPGLGGLLGQTGELPITQNQEFPSSSSLNGSATSTAMFNAGGANNTSSSSKFGIVSNDPSLDYFVTSGNVVELIKPDGTIETISDNTAVVLSDAVVSNIINAAFSYDGKKAFVTYQLATTTQTSVFDIASKTWSHLPRGIESPVWSPVNYQIAYLTQSDAGAETLSTIDASATTTKPAIITSFQMEDSLLQWPNKNTIIISDRPSTYVAGSVWSFDIPSKTLSSIAYENLGEESMWNASGSALLFSGGKNYSGGSLTFLDQNGSLRSLSFATLPSKCVFGPSSAATSSTSSVNLFYCAAPADQAMFSIVRLPDEYDQKVYFSNDIFYSVDTGSGALAQLFSYSAAGLNIDATKLKVFNNILFFINRYDQKIYALAL